MAGDGCDGLAHGATRRSIWVLRPDCEAAPANLVRLADCPKPLQEALSSLDDGSHSSGMINAVDVSRVLQGRRGSRRRVLIAHLTLLVLNVLVATFLWNHQGAWCDQQLQLTPMPALQVGVALQPAGGAHEHEHRRVLPPQRHRLLSEVADPTCSDPCILPADCPTEEAPAEEPAEEAMELEPSPAAEVPSEEVSSEEAPVEEEQPPEEEALPPQGGDDLTPAFIVMGIVLGGSGCGGFWLCWFFGGWKTTLGKACSSLFC